MASEAERRDSRLVSGGHRLGDHMTLEERIRMRAHRIWEEEGKPEGKHHEHWERARREVDLRTTEFSPAKPGGTPTEQHGSVQQLNSGGSTGLVGAEDSDDGMPDTMGVDDLNVTGSLNDRQGAWPSTGRSKLVGT